VISCAFISQMSDKNEKVSIEKSSTVTKRKIEDTSNSSETLKVD